MKLLDIGAENLSDDFLAFFRYREVAGRVLLTSLEGRWALLEPDEFRAAATGAVEQDSDLYRRLDEANLIRASFDEGRAEAMLRDRSYFVGAGPNLHIIVVTLRCNTTCVYCHASRAGMEETHTDMTKEVAEKTVDLILSSTNPSVTIEFQGGEPLVHFPVVQHIIEYAFEANKSVGKELEFTMVSNLAMMDEEKLDYLMKHRVQICTSIDGPKEIHDKQRKLPSLSAHDEATHWVRRINERYRELGLDETLYHVEALVTTTKRTLPAWKQLVDGYVDLGCRALFLRPLDPFGFADKTGSKIEYPRKEFLDFYRNAVDYIIELNRQGVEILERYASIFLTKILVGEDPNFLDIRSPSGAGIAALAYNYDGKVFTCDEGRMLNEMGDDTFLLGDVRTSSYRDIVGHETVRALVIASQLSVTPDCVNCTYQPYCGVPPSHSYKTQGTVFGRMRESSVCQVHKGIQDYLFEKVGNGDREVQDIFRRWTTVRRREHFLHPVTSTGS